MAKLCGRYPDLGLVHVKVSLELVCLMEREEAVGGSSRSAKLISCCDMASDTRYEGIFPFRSACWQSPLLIFPLRLSFSSKPEIQKQSTPQTLSFICKRFPMKCYPNYVVLLNLFFIDWKWFWSPSSTNRCLWQKSFAAPGVPKWGPGRKLSQERWGRAQPLMGTHRHFME